MTMPRETPTASPKATSRKMYARLMLAWVFLPLIFLIAGGSLGWWEAWAYCAVLLVPMSVFGVHMARVDPAFIERRFSMKEKEQTQRRVVSWGSPLIVALYVVPGLDRRFGWSEPPLVAVVVAQVLALGAYLGVLRVFLVNRWAGRTVETRPGQQVVSTGPYAVVRHPMYAASLVFFLASPLALGSGWALIPAILYVPVLVARIVNEEGVLVRELAGYEDYRAKVRYRLVPFIW